MLCRDCIGCRRGRFWGGHGAVDYMRYSDVSDISKDDVRCPNTIHSFMTTAGGGRWYVDVAAGRCSQV